MSSASSMIGISPILYGSSKAALDQISRCMAVELGPHNIRVNCINPALVPDTPMGGLAADTWGDAFIAEYQQQIPMKKFLKMDDVVHTVLYLASDKADMITGAVLPIDGGYVCT